MEATNDAALTRARTLPGVVPATALPYVVRGWRTGIEALDGILPQGVPRGRLVEWAGPRTSGKGAALASLVSTVLGSGEGGRGGKGVAYVHAVGTLAPRSWALGTVSAGGVGSAARAARAARAGGAAGAPFWVVRVPDEREGWEAVDVVLRMGVFGLVVSEGAPPPKVALRLERLARSSGAAWVVVVERANTVPGAALRAQFALAER
ncbi:MAG: hypothetical protein ACREKI_09425, partial [Gemmatimonadota bacterium]